MKVLINMHLECNGVSIIIKFFQRLIEQIGQILIHVIINTHQVNKIELNFDKSLASLHRFI